MLTLQYISYGELQKLSSEGRLKAILGHVKEDRIVLLEGRLKKQEEADLIKITMFNINEKFKGVELATFDNSKEELPTMKRVVQNMILGDRQGITIIGPASVIKEIKRNPGKIELLTAASKKKKSRKK